MINYWIYYIEPKLQHLPTTRFGRCLILLVGSRGPVVSLAMELPEIFHILKDRWQR